jgi:plasmid maintenance system killer protein
VLVRFDDRELESRYQSRRLAERAWGAIVARRYVMRIDAIRAAARIADLYANPAARLHSLNGSRQGRHAIAITGQTQLVVTFEEDGKTVAVEEVVETGG